MTIEELQALRDSIVDDDQLPATATKGELHAHQAKRTALDRRIMQAREAQATLSSLPTTDRDTQWLDELRGWRQTLVDELLTIKSPTRDKVLLGKRTNLTLSLKVIDRGLQYVEDSGYDLVSLRLGALMIESGYQVIGADPARNYSGSLPWLGSVAEVEKRLKDLAERRRRAEAALAAALQDDAEREREEAQAKRLRDAANELNIVIGPDGKSLRVIDRDHQEIDEATLPELQQQALRRMRESFFAGAS